MVAFVLGMLLVTWPGVAQASGAIACPSCPGGAVAGCEREIREERATASPDAERLNTLDQAVEACRAAHAAEEERRRLEVEELEEEERQRSLRRERQRREREEGGAVPTTQEAPAALPAAESTPASGERRDEGESEERDALRPAEEIPDHPMVHVGATSPAGARVSINGRYVGNAPIMQVPVSLGGEASADVEVVISMDGYESQTFVRTLTPGDGFVIQPSELRPRTGLVRLVVPDGSRVTVGRRVITQRADGGSPLEFSLPANEVVRIAVSAPGYETWQRTIRIEENRRYQFRIEALVPLDSHAREPATPGARHGAGPASPPASLDSPTSATQLQQSIRLRFQSSFGESLPIEAGYGVGGSLSYLMGARFSRSDQAFGYTMQFGLEFGLTVSPFDGPTESGAEDSSFDPAVTRIFAGPVNAHTFSWRNPRDFSPYFSLQAGPGILWVTQTSRFERPSVTENVGAWYAGVEFGNLIFDDVDDSSALVVALRMGGLGPLQTSALVPSKSVRFLLELGIGYDF